MGEATSSLLPKTLQRQRRRRLLRRRRRKSAVHGDSEIDCTQVDSTRRVEDYDDETQGAIRKIMFDQDQKRKGLPGSDELKNEDMLRKAWDAEGSPFKGQPFD